MSNIQEQSKKNAPKKKSVSEQSITDKDRIQAAIRSPQYQKDWSAYSQSLTDYVEKLPEHLGLREEDLVPDDLADDPVAKKWNLSYPARPPDFPRKDFVHYSDGNKARSCHRLDDQGPRYLDIRVHLEAPVQDIQKHVMELVNTYRELCGIRNRNPRPTMGVDIWKVYDMKTWEGKNLMMIARALWPKENLGNPRESEKAKSRREQISRAVKRTTQIVKKVEEEAAQNKTPIRPHPKMFKHLSHLFLPYF